MYVTSVAAANFVVPVNQSPKAQTAAYQKDIKTLKNFKDLLNKEVKTIAKSKMDRDFKQEAVAQLGFEKNLVDAKIEQLTAAVKDQKNGNHYANAGVQSVTVAAYGISHLA